MADVISGENYNRRKIRREKKDDDIEKEMINHLLEEVDSDRHTHTYAFFQNVMTYSRYSMLEKIIQEDLNDRNHTRCGNKRSNQW